MPSQGAAELFVAATQVADDLYYITVTDPWHKSDKGGNWEDPQPDNQRMSGGGLFGAISGFDKSKLNKMDKSVDLTVRAHTRVTSKMDRAGWLKHGVTVMANRKGVCTDCAAAVAYELNRRTNLTECEASIEVISTGTHAFVVVNREGDVKQPNRWGEDCFVVDVWMQNQFTKGSQAACAWIGDDRNGSVAFIKDCAGRLQVDVSIRGVIEAVA